MNEILIVRTVPIKLKDKTAAKQVVISKLLYDTKITQPKPLPLPKN